MTVLHSWHGGFKQNKVKKLLQNENSEGRKEEDKARINLGQGFTEF